MKKYILLAALALGACQSTSATPSPASLVYAAENAYEAALIVAVRYNETPRCGFVKSPPICSDAAAVSVTRKANDAARLALDGAEKTVRDPAMSADAKTAAVTAATNAVTTLQGIISLYAPKGK